MAQQAGAAGYTAIESAGMKRPSLVSAVAFTAIALLASSRIATAGDIERESADRVQIEKLMWKYVRALDTGNGEAYAAVYTPNGQFGSGANAVKGREALKKMIDDFRQRSAANEAKTGEKRPPMYHVLANSYLEFLDKDHARMQAYWMTVSAGAGEKNPSRVLGAGREIDEIVRVNGQWLIDKRDVAPTEEIAPK